MRVIDASALTKYVNREMGWEHVEGLLFEGCMTLNLALKEVVNSLWKRVRRGEITEEQATELTDALLEAKIVRIFSQEPLLTEALRLSVKLDITIYDSLYIVLARQLRADLITSDITQAKKAEQVGIRTLVA